MYSLKMDADDCVLVIGPGGHIRGKFNYTEGSGLIILNEYRFYKERSDEEADIYLRGLIQGFLHSTMISMEAGKPLTPFIPPESDLLD